MDISIILCYLIGGLFAFFGIVSLKKTVHDKKVCKTEVIAKIVDYEIQQKSGGKNGSVHNHYYPIFSFCAEGKEIRQVGNVGFDSEAYPVGSDITVLYEAGNPENFIMTGSSGASVGTSIVIALMGIGVLVGTAIRHFGA